MARDVRNVLYSYMYQLNKTATKTATFSTNMLYSILQYYKVNK